MTHTVLMSENCMLLYRSMGNEHNNIEESVSDIWVKWIGKDTLLSWIVSAESSEKAKINTGATCMYTVGECYKCWLPLHVNIHLEPLLLLSLCNYITLTFVIQISCTNSHTLKRIPFEVSPNLSWIKWQHRRVVTAKWERVMIGGTIDE